MIQIILKQIARLMAFLMGGWKIDIEQPPPDKCVIVGAHHTSNWDLIAALMLKYISGIDFHWAAKDDVFIGPAAWLFRSLGGIPVNRRLREGFVDQMVDIFESRDIFRLAIVPKGTRSTKPYWRTGFYYIALEAGVPLTLAYADYRRKVAGIGPTIQPSGDIQADMEIIRAFYKNVTPKFPDQMGTVQLKPAGPEDEPIEPDVSKMTKNVSQKNKVQDYQI